VSERGRGRRPGEAAGREENGGEGGETRVCVFASSPPPQKNSPSTRQARTPLVPASTPRYRGRAPAGGGAAAAATGRGGRGVGARASQLARGRTGRGPPTRADMACIALAGGGGGAPAAQRGAQCLPSRSRGARGAPRQSL